MMTEQRFERIEGELSGIRGILLSVAQIQERQTASMSNLTQAGSQLTDSIARQSEAADLRMTASKKT